jgi:hypothetical protein
MDEYEDGGGSSGFIGSTTSNGNWFTGSGKSFRGAGGFYAAFNPRGQFRAEKLRFERSMVVSWVEHYVDHYFSSEYTGTHYTDTEFKGRTLELNEYGGDNSYLNNQILHGVNFWDPSKKDWTTDVVSKNNEYSNSINELRKYGVDIYINSAGKQDKELEFLKSLSPVDVYSDSDAAGNNQPFSPAEFVDFNTLLKEKSLDPNATYFRYRSGFDQNGPLIKYGVMKNRPYTN